MILNKWILPTIGILLLLLASCTADDLDNSNVKEGETVQMHFNLQPVEMESASSATTKATSSSSKGETLSVAIRLSDKQSTATTRSSTGIDEYAINEVCVFQFCGTALTSTLVAKEYYSSPNTTNLETTLTESSGDQTVYVLANVGNITGNYTGTTTLADFQASTLGLATEASVTSGTDLPMIGTYTGATMPGLYSVSLTRLVAKLTFTCNVSLTNTGDAFTLTSARLYSVADVAQMSTPTGTYPANATTDASKYINYTAESYTAGNTLTWYIPENLKGTVSTITNEADKSKTNAPAYSTYIEVEGIYTPSGGTAEYVTYRIYPGANFTTDFNLLRNTAYNISMTIKGMNEADSRVLIPENLSINNAGTQVTANCYIANDGDQAYKFNATVMGNGAITAATSWQNGSVITPSILSPTAAFVVWETGAKKGNVIEEGSVKLVNGYVRFKTANKTANGNALIAVTDGTNILWSWHIWKVNYDPDTDYDTYKKYGSTTTFKMMKYNLGATEISNWSGTATNAGDMGLLYQWGRKDPFLGASGWTATALVPTYASGYSYSAVSNASAGTDAATSIAYSIKNPTKFILNNISSYDWLNVTSNAAQRDNLWGNPNSGTAPNTLSGSKSIYDPCPVGWRVPTQDSYRIFSTTGANEGVANVLTSSGFVKGWTFYIAGTSGATSFWPAAGYQNYNTGVLTNVSSYGCYWSSSSYDSGSPTYAGNLYFSNSNMYPLNNNIRSFGFSVRCAQE
ncbi:DUF4906 domain-containing protein [uncultured Bacteroides sp.]|uniref:DUF4906 domain-containing protein n=1 Tax=uncultured Bacteroides sp. TaxID=162156 RepID=UPI002AA928CA|nr:DUF4906 domain-containing protein [uncultured Bacteroides sp.]